MLILVIFLNYFFGFLSVVAGLLFSASFTKIDKAKYRFLKIVEGRRIQILVVGLISLGMAYATNAWKDILSLQEKISENTKNGNFLLADVLLVKLTQTSFVNNQTVNKYYNIVRSSKEKAVMKGIISGQIKTGEQIEQLFPANDSIYVTNLYKALTDSLIT